ncbi:hypothetical protein EV175_000293 [Coemansia sp. RSA 1933]|nr:hypothetical protein EV175_000293 [Coemansia sp. RSA 1933]
MDRIEFFKNFPLLPPQSLDPLIAKGCIELEEGGECIQIAIDTGATDGIYCVDAIKSTPEVDQFLESRRSDLDIRFKQCTSAVSFVKELQYSLKLNGCWDMLDDIDASLCVLQPQNPKRSDLWRRVAVGELASALLEVSSDRYYPRITVYGPSSVAGPLNAKAKTAQTKWVATQSVRENLETIYGSPMPEPESFDQKDIKLECGICFTYRIETEDADQVCASDTCAQPFHRSCLIQVSGASTK